VCVVDTFVAVLGIGSHTGGISATRVTVADSFSAVDSVPAVIADTRTVFLSMSIAHTVDTEIWASQSVGQWLLSGEAFNTDWVTELSPDAAVITAPCWFADAWSVCIDVGSMVSTVIALSVPWTGAAVAGPALVTYTVVVFVPVRVRNAFIAKVLSAITVIIQARIFAFTFVDLTLGIGPS
jgi:hypothetical protein